MWVKLQTEIAAGIYTFLFQSDVGNHVYFAIKYEYNAGTRRVAFLRGKPGVSDGTGTGLADLFSIGANNTPGEYASALIDEVGAWSKKLSATEIADLYNAGT